MRRNHPGMLRLPLLAAAVVLAATAAPLFAQSTLDHPMGEEVAYPLDSGALDNPGDAAETVWAETIVVEESSWLRLHIAGADLPAGSFIRATSLRDGEVQELDAAGLQMWSYSSAYFNGAEVMLELVAGPGTRGSRIALHHVTAQFGDLSGRACGICNGNNRVPSSEAAVGRLMPSGCTASTYCEDGGLTSAGHCGENSDIVEFNVPPSNSDCTINHPPVADQFPITDRLFNNGGLGRDWSVFTTGENNLGQTIYERYGEIAPIAKAPVDPGATSSVYGYGVNVTCELTATQAHSPGVIKRRATNTYTFDNDVRPGSSGSPLIVDGATVAVVTHCADDCSGDNGNLGTRVDRAEFAAARESMSICEFPDVVIVFDTFPLFFTEFQISPPDNFGEGDGTTPFGRTWDAGVEVTVTAPAEPSSGWCFDSWEIDGAPAGSDTTLVFTAAEGMQNVRATYEQAGCCVADFNGDGVVDTRDVLAFLNAWSAGNSEADIDGNGVIDTRDVLAYLNLWSAGC